MRHVKKHQNTIMLWSTIQLYSCQIHYNVICITLVHSITVHGVVTYVNKLRNDASIDVAVRFYIIFLGFSNELCNGDMTHNTSVMIRHISTLCNSHSYQ